MSEQQALAILKDALQRAKQQLREQGEALKRLTQEPLRFATVVAVRPPAPAAPAPPRTPEPEDFVQGAKARVVDGVHKGKTGTVVAPAGGVGQIVVQVGGRHCRYLVDPMNSEWREYAFVEPTEGPTPRLLKPGDKVRVVSSRTRVEAGTIGTVVEGQPNPEYPDLIINVRLGSGFHKNEVLDFRCEPPLLLALEEKEAEQPHGTAIVLFDGKEVEVGLPTDKPVQVGDTVKLSTQTLQIVDVVSTLLAGEVVGVQKVLDDASSEVDFQGGTRAVYNGRFAGQLHAGDRVVLDPSGLVIIRNLGQEQQKDTLFAYTDATRVSWDDIGGLDHAKAQMVEAIELPFRHPDLYTFYGKQPLKGLLLYGPPGCGKTMLGKAAATALQALHAGQGADSAFLYVKGPEVLNKFVGASEATVRRIFAAARAHKAAHGYPAVVFIDEADAILGKRGTGVSSDVERTIVPMFLAEMDGFEESGALVILATNRADTLDPAVVRAGRIDRKIRIDRPTIATAPGIFQLHLKGVPLHNGHTCCALAERATAELFHPAHALCQLRLRDGAAVPFTLGHLASGALIAGIVDQATSTALARDIASKQAQGLTPDDLDLAVDRAFAEARDTDYHDDLRDFAATLGREVSGLERPGATPPPSPLAFAAGARSDQ